MALISLIIEESQEEIVYGFPKYLTVTSNITSNIYYTLDGTDPTYLSKLYINKINIPIDKLDVTVKIFATNGIDESAIIEKNYTNGSVTNVRKFQTGTNSQSSTENQIKYPFGTNQYNPTTKFINIGDLQNVVYNPDLDGYSNGFDADGYEASFTNKPFDSKNYNIVYSTKNQDGSDKGIGRLPAQVLFALKNQPAEESKMNTYLFDPKAMVVYFDATNQKETDPPLITSQFMSLEDTSKTPAKVYSTGQDSPGINGVFIRSYHDPRSNTLTSYYYDSVANRWFIMKAPYTPKPIENLSGYSIGRGAGGRFVYQWKPYQKRFLF